MDQKLGLCFKHQPGWKDAMQSGALGKHRTVGERDLMVDERDLSVDERDLSVDDRDLTVDDRET